MKFRICVLTMYICCIQWALEVDVTKRLALTAGIRRKIIRNDFRPGESISEESLAAEYSVSRTPIREALIQLQVEGLVASEANRGFAVVSVSIERIRAYFEAVRQAYPRMAVLASTRQVSPSINGSGNTDGRIDVKSSELHFRFMLSIADSSRNDFLRVLASSAESYHCFVRGSILTGISSEARASADQELALHRENVQDALLRRNPEEIESSMSQMIEGKRVFLIANLV